MTWKAGEIMDNMDKRLIKELQGNIPLGEDPYKALGSMLGIQEEEVVERLVKMKANGQLKRIGVILRHQQSGYNWNAMIVFKVEKHLIEKLGNKLSQSSLISHCYERRPNERWPYNLYAMIHGKEKGEIENFVYKFNKTYGIKIYDILYSQEELKKTSMIYFE